VTSVGCLLGRELLLVAVGLHDRDVPGHVLGVDLPDVRVGVGRHDDLAAEHRDAVDLLLEPHHRPRLGVVAAHLAQVAVARELELVGVFVEERSHGSCVVVLLRQREVTDDLHHVGVVVVADIGTRTGQALAHGPSNAW
jgi:hypothetical protein